MSNSKNTGMGSLVAMRSALARMFRGGAGSSHNGARDVWATLGYPLSVSIDQMWTMYLRGGVASRIVGAHPAATWREMPLVRDERGSSDEDPASEEFSPFVESVNRFIRDFKILSVLGRADRLSGIGQFGVVIMGFADGKTLSEPLEAGKASLMYLQPYGEPQVKVTLFDQDTKSERYGLPVLYQISQISQSSVGGMAAGGSLLPSQTVHWTRVLHLAENLDSDNVFGRPVLQPVYNHLLDLEKVLGSSAETFWLNARGGLSLSVDADAELTKEGREALREQADEYEHQLRRVLMMQGVTAQALTTNVADPEPNVSSLLDVISGASGIPKRILIGSERGELSSSQDENNWGQRIDERQALWATPMVMVPLIQKMIDTGNIEKPQGDWWVEWPSSTTLSPERQAEIAVKRAAALSTYANSPMAQIVVPHSEFRHEFLGLDSATSFDEGVNNLPDYDEDDPEAIAEFERLRRTDQERASSPALPESGTDTPADLAMNGAQIASLRTIVESVGLGTLPVETAIKLILVGFPSVSEEMARAILSPMEDLEVPAVAGEGDTVAEVTVNRLQRGLARALALVEGSAARALRVNATPRSLYVSRPVLNAAEVRAHYRAQGFELMVPEDDMHVTLAYTKSGVDWLALPPMSDILVAEGITVPEGGARLHEQFGKAAVLCFSEWHLMGRHAELCAAGVPWQHESYNPHITLSYDESGVNPDLSGLEPWTGRIVLGPEVWLEAQSGWGGSLEED